MRHPHRRAGALADLVLCLPRNRRRRRRPDPRSVAAARARRRAGLRFAWDMLAGAVTLALFACFALADRKATSWPPPR